MDLVFYTNPMSRGRIVRWMLEELAQPYRTEIVEYGPPMKGPEYRAINPMGKVPAILHDGVVVTECGAICAHLADAFPQAGLAPPPGDALRGPYLRWMFFAAGPLEAAVTNKALDVAVPQERAGMVGYGSLALVTDVLDQLVSAGDYILGARFSAADIYLGSQIMWGVQFGTLEKRPAFLRYAARLGARPAARRAREIDDALAAAKPQPGG